MEEQEAFHSKPYDFNIPKNINDDFNGLNKQYSDSKKLSSELINSNEMIQQKMKRQNFGDIDDDDDVYSNPNFHSKEQDDLEIPDYEF
ncbi:unnamed protein product [Rhizophagus irregularis]|uniref:Uncharacterized protein n=1 Tax=Rhizophagus irregularis TaxID=588596 RepID=A0A915YWB1_9GLOM|nr:unnamed protein product [Rhizophagus irregularis]